MKPIVSSAQVEGTSLDYERLVSRMLSETRDEVSRADTKASILLGLYSAIQAILVSALASGSWSPSRLKSPYEVISWSGWVLALVGLIAVGLAVYPRTANSKKGGCVTYFGHVTSCRSLVELRAGLAKAQAGSPSRDEEQLLGVSRIASAKYACIKCSMWLAGIGMMASIASIIGDQLTKP